MPWSATESGLPDLETIVSALGTAPGAVDLDDPAGLLAEDQQLARVEPVAGRFDRRRRRRSRSRRRSAGSNRLAEFSVVGEPLVAVPRREVDAGLEDAERLRLLDRDEPAGQRVVA